MRKQYYWDAELAAIGKQVREHVRGFFAGRKYVYATPGTDNHSANFYGYESICKLNQRDVIGSIEAAIASWHFPDEDGEPLTGNELIEAAVEAVINDLQYDRPRD